MPHAPNVFHPIRTQSDIDQFPDRTNGLHDGSWVIAKAMHWRFL